MLDSAFVTMITFLSCSHQSPLGSTCPAVDPFFINQSPFRQYWSCHRFVHICFVLSTAMGCLHKSHVEVASAQCFIFKILPLTLSNESTELLKIYYQNKLLKYLRNSHSYRSEILTKNICFWLLNYFRANY